MNFTDINQRVVLPDGYVFTNIAVEGSFLRMEFRRIDSDRVMIRNVYLNDFGREVMRTDDEDDLVEEKFPEPHYATLKWYSRIVLWFALLWYDIQEELPCLRK